MTAKELKLMEETNTMIRNLTESNRQFAAKIDQKVADLEKAVDKKHIPADLEGEILKGAQQSVAKVIDSALTGYGSPLIELVLEVVEGNRAFLKTIISESFDAIIKTDEFRASIVAAFSHKVARSIIATNNGLFDKVSNKLKQDAAFKAKMSLAVSKVVEECLKGE